MGAVPVNNKANKLKPLVAINYQECSAVMITYNVYNEKCLSHKWDARATTCNQINNGLGIWPTIATDTYRIPQQPYQELKRLNVTVWIKTI